MKKHLLFNQSFGTVGSPNQTGETLTRENRVGLMSYLRRTLMLLFAVLVMSMTNVGMAWADTSYYLFTPTSAPNPSHTGTLSGNFVSPTATSDSRTIDTYTFTKKVNIGSALGTGKFEGSTAGNKSVDYHVKTTSTTFRVYLYNNSTSTAYTLYYATITEGSETVSETSISVAASFSGYKEFTVSSTTNTTVGIYFDNTNIRIMQVIATESGTAHKQAGEAGYTLSFNKGRIALNSSKTITTEGLSIKCENNFSYASTESLTFKKNNPTANYLSFTTPAGGSKIKVTWSGSGQIAYNTSAATAGATSMTSGTEYTLNGSTTYYVINSSSGSGASITKLEFKAAAAKAYTVTAATSTGDNSLGTVSATASSLDAAETTTITATPATGYKVTNWAVSDGDNGASISPNGASNSNTTTLTMGTANATVTATFGPKSYTVTLNNQSATTAGTKSVTTTYNSNTNLTSTITKPTKTGYVFAGYFTGTNGTGIQLIDPAGNWIASAGGGSTYTDGSKNWKYDNNLTLYACWMEYCPGMDMAAQAISLGSGEHKTWTGLTTNKILYSVAGNTTFDDSSDASNAYDGLKFKNNGDYILFLVQANSSLKLYFGYTDTKPKISINGGAESNVNVTSTQTKTPDQEVDFGTETYDRLIKLRTVTSNTVVLQKIEITSAAPSCSDDTGLAYGTGTVDKTYGDAVFTNTLTNSNSLSVTYSSSNTNVATVNESTGAVTIAGAGTTTITATWAGNATYCEDAVSYTLNVKPAVGSVSGAWDRFGGETISLSVTPSGGSSYTYQWQKYNGSGWDNVSNGTVSGATTTGATSANLQIANCGGGNSGTYRCQVTAGSQTNETGGLQVKVFTLECYNGGTTVYNFTRDGENQAGSVEIDLAANTAYTFKFHVDNVYYGNNASINGDISNYVFCNSDNGGNCAVNFTVNSGSAGGKFIFTMDYSTGGNSSVLGEPELSVRYPRKRIYMRPSLGPDGWTKDSPKFFIHSWGLSDYDALMTEMGSCDAGVYYADIYASNTSCLFTRQNPTDGSINTGSPWNKSNDITIGSNDYFYNSGWSATFTGGTYSTPTYTIRYAKGSVPTGGGSISGSKSNETKTCGVDFTLPSSAVFTTTGYTQTGWTTSDGGAQEYALGGTYTTNEDKTFYPVWTVNNYDLTWNLGGGTTTSTGTGIASGVSVNTTTSQAYGTALTAPTVTKANYTFSAWSPTVASTMPAEDVEYTATWAANQYSVTHSLTGVTTSSGATGANAATYGTDYSATFAASSGYTLPNSVTVTAGGSDITANCTYTKGTGTVSIPGSYITGNIVITVTGVEEVVCPSSASGAVVYKFVTKSSGLGTSAICAAASTDYPLTTGDGNPLETLTSGTLTARASSAGTTNLKYNKSSINFNGGSAGWLIIGLNCAIQSGDIIRYVNSNSGSVAIHTAQGTSTNEIVLAGNSKTTIQTVVISAAQATAFNGLKTIYMERKSGTSDISYFEIIRPYVVTLDANTNGGKVGGANTATYYAASGEEIALPHAFKSGNYFNGWFPNASTGDAVSNPYTPTGSTTLYAQFGDCPDEGTVYKFQVATGLTNGNVTEGEVNLGNYVSALEGGSLTAHQNSSKLTIVSNSKIQFADNNVYLKIDLDCALQTGDKFITSIETDKLCITNTESRSTTNELVVGTKTETDVPAAFVGSKTLWIWRNGTNSKITYFEVYRPERFAVTYHKNDGSATTQVNTVSTVEDNMFTRNGYTFVKWHTEADGTSGVDKAVGAAVTAAIDLYAIWECTTPTFDTDLSTTPHVVREGDDAVTLTVAASANSGTVTYQWYSNTSKSTAGATTLTTGATYNAPTSSVGTLYYYCVATNTSGGGCTAQSAYATVTVNEVPCFEFAGGTKDSGWPVAIDGSITTSLYKTSTGAVLTGGTVVNSGTATIGSNDGVKGLVFDAAGNNAITITLSGTHAFAVGTVITISGASGDDNSSSNNFGFSVNGNNLGTTSLSTAKASFEKSYTVAASDGVEGGKTIQIKLNTSCLRKTYLKSVTVTGCAEVTGYTIAFEGNGNTGGSMSDVTEIEEEDDVTLAANGFTKNGYSFANWTADVDVTINSATVNAGDPIADQATIENVSSDITLTAQWTPNTYDITYNLNGASWAGGYSAPANYTVGTGATLPVAGNMTNTGYTFGGWYDNSSLTGSAVTNISTSDYGNKPFWAKWTENTYTITYDANNVSATGSTSDTEGHYVTVADCGFELDGHMFAGWNTKSDGSGDPYSAGDEIELTADMTLYAQWGDDYTISWDASAKLNGVAVTPNLGGGNYTITASVADWTGTLTTSMISALTDGVTITNVAVDNSSSPKTITATFNVGASVAGESISFVLDVPAAGDFGAKSSTKDITIDRCTGSGSGSDGVLFSAEFKDSGLGTSNICDEANTPFTFTTDKLKSTPVGGSISAYSTSTLSHMKYATNAISIAGSDGVIEITLDNAIATNDLFTYLNVNSSSSSAYLRHTTADNETDQIALTVYNSKEAKVRLTSGFNGKKKLYIVRKSNEFKLHKAAVVRPAFLMLLRDDTPTSTTNLEGSNVEITTSTYLTAILGGHVYYTSPSEGNLKIKRSDSKNYINFNNAAGYVKVVLNDALQEGDVIGFDSYNTNNLDFTITAEHTSVITTTNQLYTVNSSSALKGKTTFYIWQHSGSSDYLRGLQIARSGIAGGGGGTDQITPTLTWTPALESDDDWDGTNSRLAKETGDADFTFTVTQDKNSLGAITYASSNTSVATVTSAGKVHIVGAGEATITATMAESGCYEEATAEYDIYVVDNCEDAAGTITVKDLGCGNGYELTVSGHTIGDAVTYQWYKDGVSMGGSYVAAKCTVTVAGEYYVVVDNTGSAGSYHCAMASTNTITIEATEAATASAIVDEWYIKNGRRTPDIALVQTENATDFTVKSGSTDIWNSDGSVTTGFAGCGFYLGTEGIIYLKGQKADGTAPSGLTAGDETLTFIATSCGSNADDVEITIHKQAATTRPSVAFVVDGTKEGDFDAENEDHSVGTALYDYLDYTRNGSGADGLFDLTPQNVYSTVDEKAIRQHYSQFDAIIITDDPSTSTKIGKKSCVDAFGTMVDIRPILTMEAYVSSLANWKAKGISGNPTSPNPRQYAMKLECKDHAIFSGLDPASDNVEVETVDGVDYWTVTMVDKTKTPYDGLDDDEETGGAEKPALQGFSASNVDGLLLLGEISEGTLYTGVERQDEPAARLMLLGVQYKALPSALTPEGLIVIKNALNYLLKTDMEEVDDCSNYFTDATGDHLWSTNDNWSKGKAPDVTVKARILKPCIITGTAYAAQVDIATGGKSSKGGGIAECTGKLTIDPTGALIVGGEVRAAEAPYFNTGELKPTTANDLVLNTNGSNQSALIFNNDKGDTKATVNLYSLGRKPSSYLYQYFAIPMESLPVNPTFANETHGGTKIYTYAWEEGTSSWTRRKYYDDLYAFEGLGITTNSTADYMSYTMTGNLASTAERVVMLTYDGVGNNIIGNSYTAPINIASLVTAFASDEHVTKTVYVYCAGRDASTGTGASGSTETPGQWLAIPMNASGWEAWKGLKVIPAMQAFLIQVTAETSMTLNYDDMVRSNTANYNAYLRAPMRSAGEQETTLTRLRVADSQTHTDLYLFEGEQFSESFDNGWEATYMEGDGRSAKLYAQTETGDMAVAALPELEGTVLGFAPGKETEYTFTFSSAESGYYLNDLKLTTSVLINEANSYTFTFEEGDGDRFYISRTAIDAPAITTGVENANAMPKAQKVIVQDKMYILYNGHVYSAQGAVVR